MRIEQEIPKSRKSEKYPFDDLEINGFFDVGEYTVKKGKHFGGVIGYYNNTRSPKKFVQRKIKGQILVYRAE